MILQNLHTHSTFDDGQSSLEEMALAAEKAGLTSLGFSVHTPMPFESCWTIAPQRMPDYLAEVRRLRTAFAGRVAIYSGAEWDSLSRVPLREFDYVIGSMHFIRSGDKGSCVDNTPEMTSRYLAELFGGDADLAAESYFAGYETLAKSDEVDIIGHFDLITKFDEKYRFFHAESPRFRDAALAAMDELVKAEKIFEINTGAISRGYRSAPYPSRELLCELKRRSARITVSSDAHSAKHVDFGLNEAAALAESCGFTEVWQFDGRAFLPFPIGGGA